MKLTYLLSAVLIVVGLAFTVWWYAFAPCSFVLGISYSLKDVPVRCIHLP